MAAAYQKMMMYEQMMMGAAGAQACLACNGAHRKHTCGNRGHKRRALAPVSNVHAAPADQQSRARMVRNLAQQHLPSHGLHVHSTQPSFLRRSWKRRTRGCARRTSSWRRCTATPCGRTGCCVRRSPRSRRSPRRRRMMRRSPMMDVSFETMRSRYTAVQASATFAIAASSLARSAI